MIKKIVYICSFLICLFSTNIIFANEIYSSDIHVMYDSSLFKNLKNVNIGGYLYFPIRNICDILNIDIEWKEDERVIELKNNNYLKNDIVKNEEIAIKIGKIAIESVYGKIDDELSFKAILDEKKGIWTVSGFFPNNNIERTIMGGTPIITISKNNGSILNITYSK